MNIDFKKITVRDPFEGDADGGMKALSAMEALRLRQGLGYSS